MHSRIGMTVDGSCFGGNEQLAAVRSKAVAVECLERAFACGSGIKQHFHGFSRFEGVLDDLCPVRIHLRIMFPVSRDGDNAGNILRSELARYDFFQIERLATLGETCQRTEAEEKCDTYLFHIYLLCLSVSLFFWGTNIQQREDLSKQWADFILLNRKARPASWGRSRDGPPSLIDDDWMR